MYTCTKCTCIYSIANLPLYCTHRVKRDFFGLVITRLHFFKTTLLCDVYHRKITPPMSDLVIGIKCANEYTVIYKITALALVTELNNRNC